MAKYYEPRFWGLDPVFSARIKLNVMDVLSLEAHPSVPGEPDEMSLNANELIFTLAEVYCISNHPVQSVQIMGDVVSIQKKSRMVKYEGTM